MYKRLSSLRTAMRTLAGSFDPSRLSDRSASWVLQWAVDIERFAGAIKLSAAAQVAAGESWRESGAKTTSRWLAEQLGVGTGEAYALLDTAKQLASLPATADAVRRGELSGAQAREIADAATANPGAEASLLATAKVASLAELKDDCRQAKAAASPTSADERYAAARKARHFKKWTDREDRFGISGSSSLDDGAQLMAVLQPIADQILRQVRKAGRDDPYAAILWDALIVANVGWDATEWTDPFDLDDEDDRAADAQDVGGDVGTDVDLHVDTDGQDHADASGAADDPDDGEYRNGSHADHGQLSSDLSQGATNRDHRSGTNDSTSRRSPAPHKNSMGSPVHRDQEPFPETSPPAGSPPRPPPRDHPRPNGPPGHNELKPMPTRPKKKSTGGRGSRAKIIFRIDYEAYRRGHVLDGEVCDLVGFGPVPVAVVAQMMDDAFIAAVITKGNDVHTVTHFGRQANVVQRTALEWQNPTCSRLGCPNTGYLEIDHRDEWHRTHHTTLRELDRLCSADHDLKSIHGWALVAGSGKRRMVAPTDPRHPGTTQPTCGAPPEARPSAHGRQPSTDEYTQISKQTRPPNTANTSTHDTTRHGNERLVSVS